MGRRKDPPEVQAAKGFPGRRRAKVLKEAEALANAAEAEAPAGEDWPLPSDFARAPARYRRAIDVWRTLSAVLKSQGRRRPGYRGALARYCFWTQVHDAMRDELLRDCPKGNFIVEWTPVNGSARKVPHPALKIIADAEPILRQLEDDFGFTPRADVDLNRIEKANSIQPSLPFPPSQPPKSAAQTAGAPADPMDLMNASDSPPPQRLN